METKKMIVRDSANFKVIFEFDDSEDKNQMSFDT